MSKRQPTYTTEFKGKIVELRENGKSTNEIAREYGISKTTIGNWHRQQKSSGSFKASDNQSDEAKELKSLRKENKRLQMEVDILKQAALILGRSAE
jgi:transposase